jgi:hypothetical protein
MYGKYIKLLKTIKRFKRNQNIKLRKYQISNKKIFQNKKTKALKKEEEKKEKMKKKMKN